MIKGLATRRLLAALLALLLFGTLAVAKGKRVDITEQWKGKRREDVIAAFGLPAKVKKKRAGVEVLIYGIEDAGSGPIFQPSHSGAGAETEVLKAAGVIDVRGSASSSEMLRAPDVDREGSTLNRMKFTVDRAGLVTSASAEVPKTPTKKKSDDSVPSWKE